MERTGRGVRAAGVELPHAHVVGLDGPGLSGLAQNLAQAGMVVTGAGSGEGRPPAPEGVRILRGPGRPGVTRQTRLLVHGPEVGRDHPSRLGATRLGVRQETPAQWLGGRMRGRIGVAVAGGREAGVAAAMIGLVLVHAGLEPTVLLNTPAPQLGGWGRSGTGPHVVAEWAGEAEDLGTVGPGVAVVLGVGADPRVDHDLWAGSFRRFVRAAPAGAHVLALGHPSLLPGKPAAAAGGSFAWVSLRRGADWWGTDFRQESGRFRFRIFHRGRYVMEARLQAGGRRHVVGALAAAAACVRLGVPAAAVRHGVEAFAGLSRDFDARGSYRGVSLVDDEGGDARSVRESLAMARRAYGGRRLWAVFAPPDAAAGGRRYASAFAAADRVVVAGVGGGSRALARRLNAAGVRACRAADVVAVISELDRNLEPGDVLLTLGAGDVGTIADAFIRRLPRDRQAG